jgi:hypothetical protein
MDGDFYDQWLATLRTAIDYDPQPASIDLLVTTFNKKHVHRVVRTRCSRAPELSIPCLHRRCTAWRMPLCRCHDRLWSERSGRSSSSRGRTRAARGTRSRSTVRDAA